METKRATCTVLVQSDGEKSEPDQSSGLALVPAFPFTNIASNLSQTWLKFGLNLAITWLQNFLNLSQLCELIYSPIRLHCV